MATSTTRSLRAFMYRSARADEPRWALAHVEPHSFVVVFIVLIVKLTPSHPLLHFLHRLELVVVVCTLVLIGFDGGELG